MSKKYRVQLTPAERQELKALVSQGRAAASKQTHARILLLPVFCCSAMRPRRTGG